jgi:hypothetical protein
MQFDGSKIDRARLGTDENRMELMLVYELNLFISYPLSGFYYFNLRMLWIFLDIFPINYAYLNASTKNIAYLSHKMKAYINKLILLSSIIPLFLKFDRM